MNNYVIIRSNAKGVFFKYIDDNNIYSSLKKTNPLLVKIFMKFHLFGRSILYGDWKKEIRHCDTVILFDNGMYPDIIKYIKKINKNCKIIFYYWNFINNYNKNYLKNTYIDEIWSFDLKDCQKYGLKYNPQLFSKNVKTNKENEKKQIIFLGRNKGRKEQILNIKNKCDSLGILTDFHIIENEKDLIKYDDYLKMLNNSNCILDIIDNSHTGMTLRCMEALFLEKKLITNNMDIVNYDFYNPNNIFILGKDKIEKLNSFIILPYQKIANEIVNYYDYESWLERFFESK